jgi:hypothetical protein
MKLIARGHQTVLVATTLFVLTTLASLPVRCESSEAPKVPTTSERVRNADFVGFVLITNVVQEPCYAGPNGSLSGTNYFGHGRVQLELKGSRVPTGFRIRQNSECPYQTRLATGRFLLFGKYSGASIVPVGYYDLGGVVGTGAGSDRVLWPNCTSVDEAIAELQKALKQ